MAVLSLVKKLFSSEEASLKDSPQPEKNPTTPSPEPAEDEQPVHQWWIPKATPMTAPSKPSCDDHLSQRVYAPLREIIQDPDVDLPTLSPAIQEAMVMLEDREVDFGKLADILARDQVLTAMVLRTVNSAAYKAAAPISRLDLAIPRLGREGLRDILMSKTLKEITTGLRGDLRQVGQEIWNQALASGILVSHMAKTYELQSGKAFLIGLLHDLGVTGVLKAANDYQKKSNETVPRNVFDSLCWEWHELIGHRLATSWKLPDPLPNVIGAHHQPPDDNDPEFVFFYLVQFGDVVCSMLEISPYVPYDFFKMPCVDTLGIKDDESNRRQLAELPNVIKEKTEQF
jgi:HD-like signal output (HDOD) protein